MIIQNEDKEVKKIMKANDSNNRSILIDVIPKTEKFGNGENCVLMCIFDIICQERNAPVLKTILSEYKLETILPTGKFIPRGIMQMTNLETYRRVLATQNKFLDKTTVTPLYGLTPEAANMKNKNDDKTIRETIETQDNIIAMYPTMYGMKNKWLIQVKKEKEVQAKQHIDNTLPRMMKTLVESSNTQVLCETQAIPRRANKTQITESAMTYARAVSNTMKTTNNAYT